MPLDVLGRTRATLSGSAGQVARECFLIFKSARDGDWRLQFSVMNEEYLVSAGHHPALNTSLPFVHTARRSYRLSGPVRLWDLGGKSVSLFLPGELSRTLSFRGRRSRNKVSVGEPAEGSFVRRGEVVRTAEPFFLLFTENPVSSRTLLQLAAWIATWSHRTTHSLVCCCVSVIELHEGRIEHVVLSSFVVFGGTAVCRVVNLVYGLWFVWICLSRFHIASDRVLYFILWCEWIWIRILSASRVCEPSVEWKPTFIPKHIVIISSIDIQPVAGDVLAPTSMKNVANCDK